MKHMAWIVLVAWGAFVYFGEGAARRRAEQGNAAAKKAVADKAAVDQPAVPASPSLRVTEGTVLFSLPEAATVAEGLKPGADIDIKVGGQTVASKARFEAYDCDPSGRCRVIVRGSADMARALSPAGILVSPAEKGSK